MLLEAETDYLEFENQKRSSPSVHDRECNIFKADFQDAGCDGMDWIHVMQDRVRW
jgi:hypothetical protein